MTSTIEYHSQPATRQDRWVLEKLLYQRHGYFVEVGAHDGVRHSNTLTLEGQFGWSGLLIEANPARFAELQVNRPGATCVQAVVGPHNCVNEPFAMAKREFGGSDSYNGLTRHMPKQWLENHELHQSEITHVSTTSLYTLIAKHFVPNTRIDYMSVDVEGAEYAILETFFNTPGRHLILPTLLTVEFLYDRLMLDKLERLLEPNYILDEVRAFDACFVRRN